jgi:hypothetical protein
MPAVVVGGGYHGPALMSLTLYICLAGFSLGMEGIEFLL